MNAWAMVPCPQLVEGRKLADADFHTRKWPYLVFAHGWEWLKILESPPWQFQKPQWRKQNIELMNGRYSTLPFGCGFFLLVKDLSVEDVCLTSYASQCLHFVGRCDFRCWIHRNLPMFFFFRFFGDSKLRIWECGQKPASRCTMNSSIYNKVV